MVDRIGARRFWAAPWVILTCVLGLVVLAGCSKDEKTAFMGKSGAGPPSFFRPTPEDIVLDEDTGLQIIKNVINITISPEASEETVKKIVASINGEIVGYDRSVNFYQIRISGADLAAIDAARMKLLRTFKEVEAASRSSVSAHKNPYYVK